MALVRDARAKLCRRTGGDLEHIEFVLGHSSTQTTEKYLGGEQESKKAVNKFNRSGFKNMDRIGCLAEI